MKKREIFYLIISLSAMILFWVVDFENPKQFGQFVGMMLMLIFFALQNIADKLGRREDEKNQKTNTRQD